MNILVIADRDLDGVSSAIVISRYHELFSKFLPPVHVSTWFPSRKNLNDKLSDYFIVKEFDARCDRIYLCDICPESEDACRNLGTVLAPKLTVFDHHPSNIDRFDKYLMNFIFFNKLPSGVYIKEDGRSSAHIAFDCLKEHADLSLNYSNRKMRKFNKLQRLVDLTTDIDMWHRRYERSTELADYVSKAGPDEAYKKIKKIAETPDKDIDDMSEIIRSVSFEKEKSLALAKATLVKHKGYKKRFYTCFVDGYASWVGSSLVANAGMIAMCDISSRTVHFRVGPRYTASAWYKARGAKPDCLDFAIPLGGGGHHQAAGVSPPETMIIFKELSDHFGKVLLEKYNDR